jgi:hypothetical protein
MTLVVGKAANDAAIAAGPADLRELVRESVASLEAAILAADTLAQHGITESLTFERLYDFLNDALAAARKAEDAFDISAKTIFPNAGLARSWCERHPLPHGRYYQIHPDGMGRCSISISQIIEYL